MKISNKSGVTRWTVAVITSATAVAILPISKAVHGADAAAPATQPAPTTAPLAARSTDEINADIQQQFGALKDVMAEPDTLTDQTKRAAAAPKAIPVFKKILADFNELEIAQPAAKEQIAPARAEFTMFLALMGDADAVKRLQITADSKDPLVSLQGKSGQIMIAWLNASKDEPAQTRIVDQVEKLAKDHPESRELTGQMLQMTQMGSPSKVQSDRLQAIIGTMKNEVADAVKQQLEATHKLESIEGKPLTIAGKELGGKDFSTGNWKGKVILVDFWATWCGPCRAELPRVKKMYADYHSKGLEVLGVSNDMSADDLTKFLEANKDMPWPQLFDANAAQNQQWNPITTGFGINGIPTMFLIDKKGVCRSVTAREKMEEMIPQLLAE